MVQHSERLEREFFAGREVNDMVRPKEMRQAAAIESRDGERAKTNLGGFFTIIGRHLAGIALATLLATLLAVGYLAIAKPVYTASTSLFIDPRLRKVVGEEVVQGNLGSDQVLVESQVSIIGSDGVLRRVVQEQRLDADEEFAPEPGQGLLSQLKALVIARPAPADAETRAVIALSERLKVKRAQKTYVVDVEVSSKSPVKAARLSAAVVDAYLADVAGAKAAEARRANKMIDARLDELRAELRNAETRVDEFRKANKILTSEGGLVTEQQLTRLGGELITARAVAAESKARLDQVNAALANGGSPEFLPDALRSNLIQRLREQYAQVARREAALATQLQGRHPALIEVRSQVEEIRGQIAAELKRISTSAKSEYQIAASRVEELQRTLDRAKDEVAKTNTAQIRLRELEQEVAASRELLNTFLTRAKQTQEQGNLAVAEARVISPASVPTKPSKPMPLLVLALGVLGGLGLGVARALVKEHMDRSVRTADEVEIETGTRAVAALPVLGSGPLGRLVRARTSRDRVAFSDVLSAMADPRDVTGGVAYRQAVLRLLARLRGRTAERRTLVTMVVSAHAAAGTSSTALALAYAAAMTGEKTLLVDAASSDVELSMVLAGDLDHKGVIVLDNKAHLQAITRRDQRSGLVFLPIALADIRLLKSHQRKRLANGIAALAQGYDLVFIDGGALLEDESAASLLGIVDQVVVVARAGITQAEALAELALTLAPAGERVVGTVLNMATGEAVRA